MPYMKEAVGVWLKSNIYTYKIKDFLNYYLAKKSNLRKTARLTNKIAISN